MGLFNKKKRISKEIYGEKVLSQIILVSAQKSPDLYKELGITMEFTHYLFYLEYLLFLSGKILEQKYTNTEIKIITYSAINGMIDSMNNVPANMKNSVKATFSKMYSEFETQSEKICSDIGSKQGMKNLAVSFLGGLGLSNGMLENVRVFTELSSFIIYHTKDILSDEFIID